MDHHDGRHGRIRRCTSFGRKGFGQLADGALGFSIEDGKAIMAHLQRTIVKQQCETYVLARRFRMDCERFRHIKDYTKRKIQNGVWLHRGQQPTHPELQALLAAFL